MYLKTKLKSSILIGQGDVGTHLFNSLFPIKFGQKQKEEHGLREHTDGKSCPESLHTDEGRVLMAFRNVSW